MARWMKRSSDSSFDLNLAPMLDIIVTVIPMLLLSLAFIQVKMIESPVPQVVSEDQAKSQKPPAGVNLSLKMKKDFGYTFIASDHGQNREVKVPMVNGKFDTETLVGVAIQMKRSYPDHFRVELSPSETVSFNEIVVTMDALRRAPAGTTKFSFKDSKSEQPVETDLMFPDVVMSNVVAE